MNGRHILHDTQTRSAFVAPTPIPLRITTAA